MKARMIWAFLLALVALPATVGAESLVIPGPTLTNNIRGWTRLGLEVTALKDVVLEQFVFNNQGQADVLRLEDSSGAVLGEYQYGGGEPVHMVHVQWPLAAGASYRLVSQNSSNGRWAAYSQYPTANDHVRVDTGVGNGARFGAWWFNFTGIQTADLALTLTATIDVKPGDSRNAVNLKSRGKIPVAIYSSQDFDATDVVVPSIHMAGATVAAQRGGRPMAKRVDVNEDGLIDLLVMFNTFELVPELLPAGAATLTGVTADGLEILGEDQILLVPGVRTR